MAGSSFAFESRFSRRLSWYAEAVPRQHTKDIDLGYVRILGQLAILSKKPHVKIGINEQEGREPKEVRESGVPVKFRVLDVALVHEFGSRDGRIPQRSFVRATSDKNRRKWFGIAKGLKDRILRGQATVSSALDLMGVKGRSDMQRTIQKGIPPALAASTLRRRRGAPGGGKKTREIFGGKNIRVGKATPLIDTGQLLGSIQYVKVLNPGLSE